MANKGLENLRQAVKELNAMLQVRIFKVVTGKMVKMLDESLQTFSDLQQVRHSFLLVHVQ